MLSRSQSEILSYFKKAIKSDKLNQTYILYGDCGVGKKYICKEILKTAMCESNSACGVCGGCLTVESKANPNIIEISNEDKKIIDIEKIRFLKSRVYMKPVGSKYGFYVIMNAHLMTVASQNALLKIIEEPPEYAIFILICDSMNEILPTVVSRSFVFNMQPFTYEEVNKICKADNFMYSYSMGSMSMLKKTSENEQFKSMRNDVIKNFLYLFNNDEYNIYKCIDYWNDNREYKDEMCRVLTLFIRDTVYYKNNLKEKIINNDKISEIEYIAEKCDLKKCIKLLDIASNAEKRFGKYDEKIAITVQAIFMQLKEEIDGRSNRSKI